MLLTADLHLDDNPNNDYRWQVFDRIRAHFREAKRWVRHLHVLGDVTDRRDRHSGTLINRIMDEFRNIASHGVGITILMGNHDAPLRGDPYWKFLSTIPGLRYVSTPTADQDRLLLPASSDPCNDWRGIRFANYKTIFMHQTVKGALLAPNVYAESDNLPLLPRYLKIYSGDLHTPQKQRNIVYVGAPHPKNFGDDHKCRMLELDDDYNIANEIILHPPRKQVIEIDRIEQLAQIATRKGDQVRFRMYIEPGRNEQWAIDSEVIIEWAKRRQVILTSLEGVRELADPRTQVQVGADAGPADVFKAFAASENLDSELHAAGLAMLGEIAYEVEC